MHFKHGLSKHPLYATWSGMKMRCLDEKFWAYKYYGGRGITIHPPWLEDVRAFISYIEAELGPRPDGHTIDRIDNDGNYEPGNLRWATRAEQLANKRPKPNKLGLPGVKKVMKKGREKFVARKVVNGKRIEVERATPEEALAALEARINPPSRKRTVRDRG